MNLSKLISIIVGLALVFGISAGAAAQGTNIGVVELQAVVQQHPEAMEYQMEIQEKLQSLQKEFEEETSELDPEEDSEKMQEIQQEFQQEATELQEGFQDEIMNILEPDFKDFMNENDYDMIAQQGGVIVTDADQTDVTEEFVEFVGGGENEVDLDVEDDDL
ncbi:MAG: OmpH family outer membrane protein [Bacillota bacterium]